MEYSQLQVYCVKILVYCRFPWFMHSNIFSPLPTIHMNHYMRYGGVKWSLSTGVDNGTFTCIEGSAPRHAWGLGGWVADLPLRCY